jgi:hypothetical protein
VEEVLNTHQKSINTHKKYGIKEQALNTWETSALTVPAHVCVCVCAGEGRVSTHARVSGRAPLTWRKPMLPCRQ